MTTRESEAEEFERMAYLLPGPGRPTSPQGPTLSTLASKERGLRRPTNTIRFKRPPVLIDRGPSFSVDRFADELRSRLLANAKGWAFAINLNGDLAKTDADGLARTAEDGGPLDMTPSRRLNIASVSKTITAVAVLRLLGETGRSVDEKIWPYLPNHWTLGPGITDLRFRDLLRHESGLASKNSMFDQTLGYDGLAEAIEIGSNPAFNAPYLNANYALFRVIIPALWNEAGLGTATNESDTSSAFFYAAYVVDEVFGQMDGEIGPNASTGELDDTPTRYYNDFGSETGISLGNWAMIAGGGGWHLSAQELAAFLAYVTYTDKIIDASARAQMDELALGWHPLANTAGQFGQYHVHSGAIGGGGGDVKTAIVKFSIQCEVAVVANSAIAGTSGASSLAVDAFEAAWS